MIEKPNYYAIIPASVRYDERLKDKEKLLYGEITSLSQKDGVCYATNKYFADLYNVDKITISRYISDLKKYGYIDIELTYKNDSKEIENRYIKISDTLYTEKSIGYIQKNQYPIYKNIKGNNIDILYIDNNNTSINNTSIKNKEKKKEKKVDFSNIKDISSYIDNLTEEEKNNLTQSQKDCINFEIAWNLYPNKKGKEKAKQYFMWYLKGRNINGSIVKLSSQQMIDATQSYADEIKKNKIELKYVKNGSTFYNYDILDYVE